MGTNEPAAPLDSEAQEYAYDFFKYLTSLTLLTLAGIMAVSQFPESESVKRSTLLTALGIVSASGICAFSGITEIIKCKARRKPTSKGLPILLWMAPSTYLIGIGYFIFMFIDIMN